MPYTKACLNKLLILEQFGMYRIIRKTVQSSYIPHAQFPQLLTSYIR